MAGFNMSSCCVPGMLIKANGTRMAWDAVVAPPDQKKTGDVMLEAWMVEFDPPTEIFLDCKKYIGSHFNGL